MYYIGVDPGKSGGIAIVDGLGNVYVSQMLLAGKNLDVVAIKNWIIENSRLKYEQPSLACIENVHAMPGQGVTSMFKFGFVTGIMHGIFGTLEIPMHLVTPQAWKKKILVGTKKDKTAAVEYCRRVYPNISLLATKRSRVPHNGMADALCIARYASLTINIEQ